MTISTRFPQGLTNVDVGHPMRDLPLPDPSRVHLWFDDFNTFTAADWVITTTEAGSGAAAEGIADADGGLLVIVNDNADNDVDSLQTAKEVFRLAAGKRFWFKARMKVADAIQSDWQIGLIIRDTTPFAPTDALYFSSDDGDAVIDARAVKNGTSSLITTGYELADDTFVELAMYYDGSSGIEVWVNNGLEGVLPTTNLPDDEDLCVTMSIRNGEAAANILSVDYIMAAKER